MKKQVHLLSVLTIFTLLTSFKDFEDFWVIKINGRQLLSNENNREHRSTFRYEVSSKDLKITDSIEVEYYVDYMGVNEIRTYFLSENIPNEKLHFLTDKGTYLLEQKSLGQKSYKLSLFDIFNVGNKQNSKSIRFYPQGSHTTSELCRVTFK